MISDNTLQQIYKLKNVIRYNCRNHLKDESVAEHSFYVALISLTLCDQYCLSEEITLNCIVKALLHDMPEIELNDITFDVKNKLNLRRQLKQYEDKYYSKFYIKHMSLMCNDIPIVDAVVKYADVLSVRQFCLNELSLGNQDPEIMSIFKGTAQRLNECKRRLEKEIMEENE